MPHAHHASVEFSWISAGLILAGLLYLRGWLRLRRLDLGRVPAWRAGSFIFGLLLIWLAIASPLSALDHEMLTAHMVQHLLLMTFAAPSILLGKPVKTLTCGMPLRLVQVAGGSFQSTGLHQVWAVLTHPVICWLAAASTLVVWHIPDVFALGLRSQMWHGIEQASFLASGLLFWWPVVQPLRIASKWPESFLLVYLFLATLPCDILSGFLVFCERVVYPVYLSSSQPFGLSALEDQQCAGALMWTCVTLVYLIAGALVTARLLSFRGPTEYATRQSETPAIAIPKGNVQTMEMV